MEEELSKVTDTVSDAVEQIKSGNGSEVWDKIKDYLVEYGLRLIIAIAVIFIGFKLIKFVVNHIEKRNTVKLEKGAATFLRNFVSIALKCLVVVIAISILGIPMTTVVTIIGTASLAIGLALQGSLTNLAGGFMIVIFKPFKVGDFIDNHTDSGTVTDIGIFYTRLVKPDGTNITIPNGLLSNATVINYSVAETRRVDIDVSVSYDSDIENAKKLLIYLAKTNPLSLKDPEPFAAVTEHGDSAIKLTLRVWTKNSDYWTLKFDLLEKIKASFDEFDIEIPYNYINVVERKHK